MRFICESCKEVNQLISPYYECYKIVKYSCEIAVQECKPSKNQNHLMFLVLDRHNHSRKMKFDNVTNSEDSWTGLGKPVISLSNQLQFMNGISQMHVLVVRCNLKILDVIVSRMNQTSCQSKSS